MEVAPQREQRRGRESRPRGGRAAGARQERDSQEKKDEKPRNEKNGQDKRPEYKPRENQERRPRLEPVHLRRDIKEIKLNEEQAKLVAELDQKIAEAGKIEIPTQEERVQKCSIYDKQIDLLNGQLAGFTAQLEEIQRKQEAFETAHNPHKKEFDETQAKIKEIDEVLNPILEKLGKIKEHKNSLRTKKRDLQSKSQGKSLDDIDFQIEDLEYKIETSTLSNTQLKAMLSQIESLKKSRGQFGNFAEIDGQLTQITESEASLVQKRNLLFEEKSKLRATANGLYDEKKGNREQIQKFWDEKKAIYEKKKVIKTALDTQYNQKKEFNDNFFKNLHDLYKKRDDKAVLENQRLHIYQDAERHMDLLEKGARQAGEIKERRNPNEAKISDARSLISFLQSVLALDEEKEEDEAQASFGKAKSTAAVSLVSSIKKASKKDKKAAKKEKKSEEKAKNSKLDLSLSAIQQFNNVGVNQPTTKEQIPEVVAQLKKKAQEWIDAFQKIALDFAIQADGSVKVSIKLE